MRVSPDLLLPSQDFLKPQTVRYILQCLEANELNKLPSTPIVRCDQNGNLIAIDGHNLIAVKLYMNEPVNIHVAESADDGLPEDDEPTRLRNQDLKDKFESMLADRQRVKDTGIDTFTDLLERHKDLFC